MLYNFIVVPGESNISQFNVETDYIHLEQARLESKRLKINSEQETDVVDKVIKFSNFIKEKVESLARMKEERIAEKKTFYE
jgi:hypothetical protein